MKKSIKVTALVMAAAMVASFAAGCSSDSGDASKPAPAASTPKPSSSNASASASASEDVDFEPVVWKFSHTRTEDSRAAIAAQAFCDEVTEKTNGNITFEMYANGSLGDYETVQERTSMGDVDIQMQDFGQSIDRSLVLPTVPYLFGGWEDVEEMMDMETGIVANFLSERAELQNLKFLNSYPQYFGSVCTTKEIPDYQNPTASRNLKVRVPTSKPFQLCGDAFGFQSTPMPSSEIFTSMQTGIIDGSIGGGTEYYWHQYADLVKYILPLKTHYVAYNMAMNLDDWNSLPAEYQQIILDAAETLHNSGWEDALTEEEEYNKKFAEEKGVTVYPLTEEELQGYIDTYRKECWPQLGEDVLGKEGVEILKQMKEKYGV
ncbi:MAG: TRAP transporter substrate-binding protein DctP [Clostridiales bacterium]|nr:TRAP transporter substrate-binding protein DctP [Clostridiales bacterium]